MNLHPSEMTAGGWARYFWASQKSTNCSSPFVTLNWYPDFLVNTNIILFTNSRSSATYRLIQLSKYSYLLSF